MPSGGTLAIIQARMTSSRLPGKVLMDFGGVPLLEYMLHRVRRAELVDGIVVATTGKATDDPVADLCQRLGIDIFRGDEQDVLGRFLAAAKAHSADTVVRLTADCPLTDPAVIDAAVRMFRSGRYDYVSNCIKRTFPDGLDVEVFSIAALEQTDREATHPWLREHVTPYIRGGFPGRVSGDFRKGHYLAPADFSHLRWTVDEIEDLEMLRRLVRTLPGDAPWQAVLAAQTREPTLLRSNRAKRFKLVPKTAALDGGARYARSNALFERALKTVPLASQTFSKSYQQWVKGVAPLFVERGLGGRVQDVDGNVYIDYLLGLLPVVLGYCDPDVDAAIEAQLSQGITFSLPHPKEMELAERLVQIIPCAEMVRFGKNGSDATAAAVRLARAHTKRDRIAVGGYHGWQDWYIGTTTRNLGVPAAVKALTTSFPFNDADALEALLKADPNGFAAVILEPAGAAAPASGFLERVRSLTERYGVVLIFDEIVTGFRIDMGGAQTRYGIVPDLATFGKAMANGMPISAVVGRREIMSAMEAIFFSVTFGGEALSLAASLATIDKLEREEAIARMWKLGSNLSSSFNEILARYGMDGFIRFGGDGWWPRIKINDPPVAPNLVNSLLRQEFNAHGLILGAGLNLCLAHDHAPVMEETLRSFDAAISRVRDMLNSPDPSAQLRGAPIQPTFSVR